MSDDEMNTAPPPPLGLTPPPPPGMDAPPPPPGMDAPPPPPGMDAPPPPPGMDTPPPPPGMDAPPPPPGMDTPPPPPGMDTPPPPPGMDTPPPPPEMDTPPPLPEMDTPPPPPGMDTLPPLPEMDAPPPPPGMDAPPPLPGNEEEDSDSSSTEDGVEGDALVESSSPPPLPEMDTPPPPPGMDAPPPPPGMDAPPPPPGMDAPPPPPGMDAPPPPPGMGAAAAVDLLSLPPSDNIEVESETSLDDDLLAAAADDLLLGTPIEVETTPETGDDAEKILLVDEQNLPFDSVPLVPAEAAPHQPAGAIAGAKIRSLDDVDQVKGDKIEGIIHEEEKTILAMDGSVIDQSVKGKLTISNPSKSDRLWDIDVLLDGMDNLSFNDAAMEIAELDAGKKHKIDYTSSGPRMLIVREDIDTNPEREQESSHSIVMNTSCSSSLSIEVENVSNVTLTDVSVTKQLPKQFSLPESNEDAEYTVSGKNLTWEIGDLGVGETRELALDISIDVDSKKAVKSGKTKAKYKANSTLSGLDFTQLDAYCRGFSYMSVSEDERPDNWQCQAIFKNRSSFVVDLVKLQVQMSGSEGMLFDVKDVPEDVLADEPGSELSEWRSETKVVEGTDRPDFTIHLGYTVLPRCQRTTSGTIELEQIELSVLDAELSKTYDIGVLRSYRPQTVTAELRMKNTGSSVINLVRIIDDIPGLFAPPDSGSINVSIDGKAMDEEQVKPEFTSGITLEENRISPDGSGHTMRLTIGNKGPVGMESGSELVITYPLNAPDPSPDNTDVAAPANCEFIAERYGPNCRMEVAKSPSVRVSHKRRKFSAGKTLIPTGGKGNYEVLIMFENNSDSPLKDVVLPDFLPTGFELKGHRTSGESAEYPIKLETNQTDEGTMIEWHIPMILCAQKIELSYDIKGDGDLKISDIQSFRGAKIGDVVDDDLPPLESDDSGSEEVKGESATPALEDYSWNEDVLMSIIDAHGITDRDAFLSHAIHYDADENMYLKKSELQNAAENFGATTEIEDGSTEEVVDEDPVEVVEDDTTDVEATDGSDEATVQDDDFEEKLAGITYSAATESTEAVEDAVTTDSETVNCPICGSGIEGGATTCAVCNYQMGA